MAASGVSGEKDRVLAAMLGVAAALVHDEPTVESLAGLAESGVFVQVPEGFSAEGLAEGCSLIDGELGRLAGLDGEERRLAVGDLQREWLRLFVGVGEPQVPSWANYYLDPESRMLGRASLGVRELYRAHGLQIEGMNTTPDDDLGLMLRFLVYLVTLECDAAAAGDVARAEAVRSDQTSLLKKYILPWLNAWRYAGRKHVSSDFYRGVVEMAYGTVCEATERLGFERRNDGKGFTLR